MKRYIKNNDICEIVMPSQKYKILELNQYMTSEKMPSIIYTDIEPLIKKLD